MSLSGVHGNKSKLFTSYSADLSSVLPQQPFNCNKGKNLCIFSYHELAMFNLR